VHVLLRPEPHDGCIRSDVDGSSVVLGHGSCGVGDTGGARCLFVRDCASSCCALRLVR
jgi:hypothetical protein